jgi:hypothetical protein
MSEISRELMIKLRTDLDKAIANLGAAHGVSIKVGRGSFDSHGAKFAIEISAIVGDSVVTKEAREFLLCVGLHGFGKDDLGREFTYQGNKYKIAGFNSRKRLSILCQREDNRSFYMSEEMVKSFLLSAPVK